MWRPKEKEWAKMVLAEVKKIPDPELLEGSIPAALLLFAEAGADAMLKAIAEVGEYRQGPFQARFPYDANMMVIYKDKVPCLFEATIKE